MPQLTITSPGVEIREWDLSLIAPSNVGTNIYVTGFAQTGPLDEVLKITSEQELDNIFGIPSTSAERYFYHTVAELLRSPANIYASRLPYGPGNGDGFGSRYSALAYPASAIPGMGYNENDVNGESAVDFASLSATIAIGSPVHVQLTENEYLSCREGTAFDWSAAGSNPDQISTISTLGFAAFIVLNKASTTINDAFEGYYIGAIDNTAKAGRNFDSIAQVRSVNTDRQFSQQTANEYVTLPPGTLMFSSSSNYITGPGDSVSEVMENLTDWDLNTESESDWGQPLQTDWDVLGLGIFKLRKSIFSNEAFKLDFVLEEAAVGALNAHRKQNNPRGGPQKPFYLGNAARDSRNIEILVNDNLSQRLLGSDGLDADGIPKTKVRLLTDSMGSVSATTLGLAPAVVTELVDRLGYADSLYPLGAYSSAKVTTKLLGDIPGKLERALDGIKNDEIYDIDVVCEAGLGTIYAAACASDTVYYDEFNYDTALQTAMDGLRTSNAVGGTARRMRNNYNTIFDRFESFVKPPYLGGDRGDCIFIADIFRHTVTTGDGRTRVLDNKGRNFQIDLYWPMRHQFETQNTSYACVYANWCLIYDEPLGDLVWVPFSGFAGAAMAKTDAATFPWFAPAGFTRGLISTAADIAINPNQKQRDELYKANLNPVAFFPSQGQVIFGQKTLSRKPSAFDRINVRRLFLALERPTKKASRFFVFEPNTEFTRTRLINTLTPIFENAKNNQGVYDYLIVCDDRNNTPQVIDENQLRVDIYIKPVRAAEFILVTFYATRTDANFEELIDGPGLLTRGVPYVGSGVQ